MTPRGIGLKFGGLAFVSALAWVTDCSSPSRNFGTPLAAGAGNESGGSAGSGGAGRAPSVGGKTNTGGAPELGGAGLVGDGGMSANPEGGASVDGAGTPGAGAAGAGVTPLQDGEACQAAVECVNGHCVDGVCCKSACTGCNACSNALTGQNNGTCAPVTSGQDPHSACADETATKQCGNDGTCDGKGACAKVGSSHVCAAAACSSDGKSFDPATTCSRDASGTCTSAAPQDCAGFPCTATGCAKPCSMNTDCSSTSYCETNTGKCVARKSDGSAATNSYECTSGIVADGVCCNNACTGKCQSCKQTPGVCKAVTAPRSSCGGSGTCGTMKCDGTHADCVSPGNEVSCPSSCSSDLTAKITSTCNGAGACGAGQSTACNAQYCSGGQCVAKLANNTGGCTTDTVCTSGNCSISPSAGKMCCAGGFSNCSQGCYNLLSDAKHCGNCSTVCAPNNSCSSGSCKCSGGSQLSCGTCPSWDFESGTEGWVSVPDYPVPVVPQRSATPSGAPFSGSYSLALKVDLLGGVQVGVRVPFCSDISIAAAGVSGFSFYLYMDGPTFTPGKDNNALIEDTEFGEAGGVDLSLPAKQWTKVSASFAPSHGNDLRVTFYPQQPWSGTIYIDHVQLTQ